MYKQWCIKQPQIILSRQHITFFISRGDRSPILVWPVLSLSSLKFWRRSRVNTVTNQFLTIFNLTFSHFQDLRPIMYNIVMFTINKRYLSNMRVWLYLLSCKTWILLDWIKCMDKHRIKELICYTTWKPLDGTTDQHSSYPHTAWDTHCPVLLHYNSLHIV